MTDRPILFSAPMVRALLDGRKTQTRRILEDQPGDLDKPFMMDDGSWHVTDSRGGHMSPLTVRFYKGDRLWVRETLRRQHANNVVGETWLYGADQEVVNLRHGDPRIPDMLAWAHHKEGDTCVSIHMPRWASRLTLTVTDVRVQRLQEISEADAIAEGAGHAYGDAFHSGSALTDRRRFELLWTDINGADSWDANPWIAAVSFTVERRNIDALPTDGAPVGSTAAGKPRLAADGS